MVGFIVCIVLLLVIGASTPQNTGTMYRNSQRSRLINTPGKYKQARRYTNKLFK